MYIIQILIHCQFLYHFYSDQTMSYYDGIIKTINYNIQRNLGPPSSLAILMFTILRYLTMFVSN